MRDFVSLRHENIKNYMRMKKMNWYFAVGAAVLSLLLSSCDEDEPAQETPADNQEQNDTPSDKPKPKPQDDDQDEQPSVDLDNIELEGTSWEIVSLEIDGDMVATDWTSFVDDDWTAGNDVAFSESGRVLIYRTD